MKGLRKRIITLAATAALAMTALVGCAGVKGNAIVATAGDIKITAKVATFYARLRQPDYEAEYLQMLSYFGGGTEMSWTGTAMQNSEQTAEEEFKEAIMQELYRYYLAEKHMDDYQLKLTDEELKKIDEVADAFIKANTTDVLKKISADKETVTEFLRIRKAYSKVMKAIEESVDETADADIIQKKISFVYFDKTTTDEQGNQVDLSKEELAKVKEEAENFLAAAKETSSLSTYAQAMQKTDTSGTATFASKDMEQDDLDATAKKVYEAADKLKDGEYAEVIDCENAYYVVQMESTFDEETTAEVKKEEIQSDWEKETPLEINKKVWKKVKIRKLTVSVKEIEEITATPSDITSTPTSTTK